MEEGGEVLSLQPGALRGGVERDGHRDIGGDELKDGRQAAVVREGFVMEALCQAGDPDEGTHDGVEMRQQCLLPQLAGEKTRPIPRLMEWVAWRAPARALSISSEVWDKKRYLRPN